MAPKTVSLAENAGSRPRITAPFNALARKKKAAKETAPVVADDDSGSREEHVVAKKSVSKKSPFSLAILPWKRGEAVESHEEDDDVIVLASHQETDAGGKPAEKPRSKLGGAASRIGQWSKYPIQLVGWNRSVTNPPYRSMVPISMEAAPPATQWSAEEPLLAMSSLETAMDETFGVGPDARGWGDNLSARVGATYYSVDNTSGAGGVAILESSKQLGKSSFFVHGGIATEFLDGDWPVSFSVGASKLATIVGDEVTKPLILSIAYDGYWDSDFFDTGDEVYLDQLRALAGYALTPRWEVGVWGATGWRTDGGSNDYAEGRYTVNSRFADRIAAYTSANIGELGSLLILSAGWEEDPGSFFSEADIFVPLRKNLNLFAGIGVSDGGAWDSVVGLELYRSGSGRGAGRGMFHRGRGATSCDPCDPCADVCSDPCDPCAELCCAGECPTRYRGGWANSSYRGALRVVTPSRMRRMLDDPSWEFTPATPTTPPLGGVGQPPVDPPPGPGPVDEEPGCEGDCCEGESPPTNPEEECILRIEDRPRRPSRLSLLRDQPLINGP